MSDFAPYRPGGTLLARFVSRAWNEVLRCHEAPREKAAGHDRDIAD